MTVDAFLNELQQRGLLSDRRMEKLRDKLAATDKPLSAKAVAKFLVQKEYLAPGQASELLGALLSRGLAIDEPLAAPGESHDDEEAESSSIFGPSVAAGATNRLRDQPASPGADDELTLVPVDDEIDNAKEPTAPAAVDRPKQGPSADPTDDRRPRTESKPKRRKRRQADSPEDPAVTVPPARSEQNTAVLEGVSDEAAPVATKARGTRSRPEKRRRRDKATKRKNEWDSPLFLLGGGALMLLVLCGGVVWWLLNRESGDERLGLARQAVETGSYTQAVAYYERFLDDFPRHPEWSLARVQLAMARIRKSVEAGNFSAALADVNDELAAIDEEEKFDEAHYELAALLPRIALGLAQRAEAAAEPDEAIRIAEQASEALALCANTRYIPRSLRDEAELLEVRELLTRLERRQQTRRDLQLALDSMESAIESGDTRSAYVTYRQVLRDHPELAGNDALAEIVRRTSAAEGESIRFVADEQPAATDERPTPWVASLALANRQAAGSQPADATGSVCARVDGALYGLEAATGRLLWRRHVGLPPVAMPSAGWPVAQGDYVLIVDAARHELVRLSAATGQLVWRHEIGEPVAAPCVVGDRVFLAAESGRMYEIDLSSGARHGYYEFAQPLRVPPTADRGEEVLYLAGEHSSLYAISLRDRSCLGVYYFGHAHRAIQVPVAPVLNKLAVLENDGVETSRLHLLSLDGSGAISERDTSRRLNGLAALPPLVDGRRLVVATDRGQIDVYDVTTASGNAALTLVATREASSRQPLTRHLAIGDGAIWVGDNRLTKYAVTPAGNRLPAQSIDASFAGTTFDHPLQLLGRTLIHVHRPAGSAGAVVAAIDTQQGRTRWQVGLAVPPAWSPIVDPSQRTLAVATANGSVYHFDAAALAARVQDQPLAARNQPQSAPVLNVGVDLGTGRAAFGAAGESNQLLLVDLSQSEGTARWVRLSDPLACAVTPFDRGLLVPLTLGQVLYLDGATGESLSLPFQPRLQPATSLDYQPPASVGDDGRRFVITDSREKIYLVAAVEGSQAGFEAVAESAVGPYPITSPLFVFGESAVAIANHSYLLRFQLPSLELVGEVSLSDDVAWGPHQIGDTLLLATANDQLVLLSPTGEAIWTAAIEYGDLAGPPLGVDGGFLLAYRNGIVERRALADGGSLAALDVEQPLAAGPVAFQRRIVLATADGALLIVDQP